MLVRIGVLEREAGRGEARELGMDLARHLATDGLAEEIAKTEPELIRRKPAALVHEIGDLFARQHRLPFDQHQMQPDAKVRQASCPGHGIFGGGSAHHQARGAENAFRVRTLDRFVHRNREPEIIGGEDDPARDRLGSGWQGDQAALWRSRRKWKNSTPSRSRLAAISGLFAISPTIEAIFEVRK